jgi:hypothetical protein
VCGERRGYAYSGLPSGPERVEPGSICPWCIAGGAAHEKLGVMFVDGALIGHETVGSGPVPREVADEIAYRTPGFFNWQGDYWFTPTRTRSVKVKRGGAGLSPRASRGPSTRARRSGTLAATSGSRSSRSNRTDTEAAADPSPRLRIFTECEQMRPRYSAGQMTLAM